MTDTLTTKELVEKTYTYVDRLIKECRKDVMSVVAKERSANANELGKAVANAVLDWFGRRDRHLRIMFDPRTVTDTPEPGMRTVFTGESNDASFKIHSHVTYYIAGNVCYVKDMSLDVDKRDFSKRA